MKNKELCLEFFSDGTVLALEYIDDDMGITLGHENPLYSGEISRGSHLAVVAHMAIHYNREILDWTEDFYVDYGDIPDLLWDEVFNQLEKVED